MANSNGWGDGSANNTIGWGKGANNTISWGKSHLLSYAGLTNIVGSTQSGGTTPPQATAPFIIKNPTLSSNYICGRPGQVVNINNMEWGGTPTPTITYSWFQDNPMDPNLPEIEIGQYTPTLYLDYSMREVYLRCVITATNSSEGVVVIRTEDIYAYDCS
jgi:hypothetical protein